MVNEGIISKNEKTLFFQNLKSITTEIIKDKKLTKKEFCKKYGHLRPSTYDISSKNYKENYHSLFKKNQVSEINKIKVKKFTLSKKSKIKVLKFIRTLDSNISLEKFIDFLSKGIQFREFSKFIFTKSIDFIFTEIKYLSKRNNISFSKLSHLNIKIIKELYYNLNNENVKDFLEANIQKNMSDFNFNRYIELPQVIIKPNDVFILQKKLVSQIFLGTKYCREVYFLEKINLGYLMVKLFVLEELIQDMILYLTIKFRTNYRVWWS